MTDHQLGVGVVAEESGITHIAVSMTHDGGVAAAVAVILSEEA